LVYLAQTERAIAAPAIEQRCVELGAIANMFVQCLEGDPCMLGTEYIAFAMQTKAER
jgi:hypothetical protein